MAMGIGRGGHEPGEVTCRIGGDRPGCDFMITKLGERWADTGTSMGRFDIGVLAGFPDVERTQTAAGRSRAEARRKHTGRPLPSHRNSGKRPPNGA